MNALKKLFSPRALAAVAGTAMLVSAATTLAAEVWFSAWTWCGSQPCPGGTTCTHTCFSRDMRYYWCCGATDSCGTWTPPPPGQYGMGSCLTS